MGKYGLPGSHWILNETVGTGFLGCESFKDRIFFFFFGKTFWCLMLSGRALRRCYREHALAVERSRQFTPFSSWLCDIQVPHTSCLDEKNKISTGMGESGRRCIQQISKGLADAPLDILYLQSKMLLTKVNDLKAYSDFFFVCLFLKPVKGFKAL